MHIFVQVKNGRRKRSWCSLHGKSLIFHRSPTDQVREIMLLLFRGNTAKFRYCSQKTKTFGEYC